MEECRNVDLIISGGISSLEDIKKIGSLSTLRIIGIIIGKALYDKKIRLEEAISLGEEY